MPLQTPSPRFVNEHDPCPKRLSGAPHIRVRSPFSGCFNNPNATYCSQCFTRLADAEVAAPIRFGD